MSVLCLARVFWRALGPLGGYLRCWEGLVFFSFVIDAYSRMIVGWQLASHMRTDLVLDALRRALHQRAPGADVSLVAHSDAGSPLHRHAPASDKAVVPIGVYDVFASDDEQRLQVLQLLPASLRRRLLDAILTFC